MAQVRDLENLACNSPHLPDRVIAGGALFGLFSCARASDLARAVHLSIDVPVSPGDTAWIESSVKGAKTATGSRSRLLLPLLAPVVPFSMPWLDHWRRAREQLALPVAGTFEKGLLMPAFALDGAVSDRTLYSDEITRWLRLALGPGAESVTSHSLKSTCLTWASQAGVPIHERRLLAHHVPPGTRSTETYSRDVLTPARLSPCPTLTALRPAQPPKDPPRSLCLTMTVLSCWRRLLPEALWSTAPIGQCPCATSIQASFIWWLFSMLSAFFVAAFCLQFTGLSLGQCPILGLAANSVTATRLCEHKSAPGVFCN